MKLIEEQHFYYALLTFSVNVYINGELDDTVNKYNSTKSTYHKIKIIKTKPADVNFSTYNDSGHENNKKNPKSKVGDCVRISTCKKKKAKKCWSESK